MTHALGVAAIAFGLSAVLGLPASAQDPIAPPVVRLTPGVVLEREMAPSDTHRYEIELRAGEYLQLLVEQHGVDVVQTLVAPDGQTVLETDALCGEVGPDPLAVVAPVAGIYQLTLKELVGGVRRPPASYELRVEAVREPGPLDLLRVKTVQANADLVRLAEAQPAVALARALEARAGWEALGDRRLRMWTEYTIGVLHWKGFDQHREAYEWLQRSLASALELQDEAAEGYMRTTLSQVLRRLGRLDEARTALERALSLHRAAGRAAETARALKVLGDLSAQTGELQSGFDLLQEALDIFHAQEDAWGEGHVRESLGSMYLDVGDPELALEQLQLALPLLPELVARAYCIAQIGLAHFHLGDFARARQAYTEALGIYKTLGNRIFEAGAYLRLGELHQEEGDLRRAREVFASALAVYGSRGSPEGQGVAQCSIGEVERRLGDLEAARGAFEAALAVAPPAVARVIACAEAGLARVARDAGELDRARTRAEVALMRAESRRAGVASQRARGTVLAADQPLYELLIDILMRKHAAEPAGGHDAAAFDVAERARARSLLELLGEGHVDVRRGVAPELLAEERSARRRLNSMAAEQAEALAAGRAERVATLNRDLDSVSAELAETEARIRRASPAYAALTQAQPLTEAEISARVLDPETQLLQYVLGDTTSYLWVVSAGRMDSFRLAPRAEIEKAARHVHELMAAPPGSRGLVGPRSVEMAARELSRLVLAPASAALSARRLLVVAPGALQYVPFAALPLPDGTPLLARFELVSAPSASVIGTIRTEARKAGTHGRTVAVFADPVFERSDPRMAAATRGPAAPALARVALRGTEPGEPLEHALRGVTGTGAGGGLGRLPFSRQEADAIVALVPAKSGLKATGFDATRDAATNPRLADYRIVHFATHGVLNARRPELSGVVFSLFDERGRKQDGFLRLHDVYNLRLDADLVVLSGCQTALGKDLRGEGLVGLTRGFMYAGARAVVASLWQVDDESTAELMRRFYRAMLKEGRRPADALRAAQLEMSGQPRWQAPFYWAGFVLQGEWR